MAGEVDGAEEVREFVLGEEAEDGAQATQQTKQTKQVSDRSGDDAGGAVGAINYEKTIGERDVRIAELEAQVAEAAKSTEMADELRRQISELKTQGESDRIDFALRLAGACNLKAARAVLVDHGGATGLEPADVEGGGERTMRCWESIAGLTDEKEA